MTTTHIKALKTFMRSDGKGFAQPGDVVQIHHADLAHYEAHGMGERVDTPQTAKGKEAAETQEQAAQEQGDKPARKVAKAETKDA